MTQPIHYMARRKCLLKIINMYIHKLNEQCDNICKAIHAKGCEDYLKCPEACGCHKKRQDKLDLATSLIWIHRSGAYHMCKWIDQIHENDSAKRVRDLMNRWEEDTDKYLELKHEVLNYLDGHHYQNQALDSVMETMEAFKCILLSEFEDDPDYGGDLEYLEDEFDNAIVDEAMLRRLITDSRKRTQYVTKAQIKYNSTQTVQKWKEKTFPLIDYAPMNKWIEMKKVPKEILALAALDHFKTALSQWNFKVRNQMHHKTCKRKDSCPELCQCSSNAKRLPLNMMTWILNEMCQSNLTNITRHDFFIPLQRVINDYANAVLLGNPTDKFKDKAKVVMERIRTSTIVEDLEMDMEILKALANLLIPHHGATTRSIVFVLRHMIKAKFQMLRLLKSFTIRKGQCTTYRDEIEYVAGVFSEEINESYLHADLLAIQVEFKLNDQKE